MKDDKNKNKNKKGDTLVYILLIGLIALFVGVQFDEYQSERQAQAKAAQDLDNLIWYYHNYM